MLARGRKRSVAGRGRSISSRNPIRRTTSGKKIVLGISSFMAGAATIVATIYGYQAYVNQSTFDVSVVGFAVTNQNEIRYTYTGPEGEEGTKQRAAVGAEITLRNSGQVAAFLTKVKVEVLDLRSLKGCFGGGPTKTTAEYDIQVPNDIMSQAPPRYVEKHISFQVEGQTIDRLAISIGPNIADEGRCPNIYVVDIWLVEQSGEEIGAGRAVLMDAGYSDAILKDASSGGGYYGRCLSTNVVLLDRALSMVPEDRRSTEIVDLRDNLKALGYGNNIKSPAGDECE